MFFFFSSNIYGFGIAKTNGMRGRDVEMENTFSSRYRSSSVFVRFCGPFFSPTFVNAFRNNARIVVSRINSVSADRRLAHGSRAIFQIT